MKQYFYMGFAIFFALATPAAFLYGMHLEGKLRDSEQKAEGAMAYVRVIKWKTKKETVYVEREKIIAGVPDLDTPLPPAIAKLCIDAGFCRPE